MKHSFAILCLAACFIYTQANPTTLESVTPTVVDNENKSTTAATLNSSKIPDEVPQTLKEKLNALTESCKNAVKISADQAKVAFNQALPKNEAERCFLGCIYDNVGLSKEGVFSEEGAKKLAQERFGNNPEMLTKANQMIDICSKHLASAKDANEKCAIGKLLRECFITNGPKINFLPKLV